MSEQKKSTNVVNVNHHMLLLTGANLKGCNMDDPTGSRALMEGVNLKGKLTTQRCKYTSTSIFCPNVYHLLLDRNRLVPYRVACSTIQLKDNVKTTVMFEFID